MEISIWQVLKAWFWWNIGGPRVALISVFTLAFLAYLAHYIWIAHKNDRGRRRRDEE